MCISDLKIWSENVIVHKHTPNPSGAAWATHPHSTPPRSPPPSAHHHRRSSLWPDGTPHKIYWNHHCFSSCVLTSIKQFLLGTICCLCHKRVDVGRQRGWFNTHILTLTLTLWLSNMKATSVWNKAEICIWFQLLNNIFYMRFYSEKK